MRPMRSQLSRQVAGILASIMISGCSLVQASTSGGQSTPPAARAKPSALVFNHPAAEDAAGLHVVLTGYRPSPYHPLDNSPLFFEPAIGMDCDQWLVLASDHLTYSDSDMQAIATYTNGFRYGVQSVDPAPSPLPSTLALPAGGKRCTGDLQVTNTGSTSLQLSHVGLRLDASPVRNTFAYRLIDVCPFLVADLMGGFCGPQTGANIYCEYSASIELGMGTIGTRFSSPISGFAVTPGGAACQYGLTIAPQQTMTIAVTVTLADPADAPQIYEATPYLTVVTSRGKQDILFPRLASTLVYANTAQFPCYEPKGTTFALLDPQTAQRGQGSVWCI